MIRLAQVGYYARRLSLGSSTNQAGCFVPFTAIDQETGERVDLFTSPLAKTDLLNRVFICPVCGDRMIARSSFLRSGTQVRAHFAHKPAADCLYAMYAQGETAEHRAGKEWVVARLKDVVGEEVTCEIYTEYHLKQIRRIADVILLTPGGYNHVFEVQLASISVEDLEQRTNDYMSVGCDVTWIIGGRADTQENRLWVADHQGDVHVIQFSDTDIIGRRRENYA